MTVQPLEFRAARTAYERGCVDEDHSRPHLTLHWQKRPADGLSPSAGLGTAQTRWIMDESALPLL